MAKEKTRRDKLIEPANIRKTRKDKRVTDCHVNRRIGCGICGSLNTVTQGVKYCLICGMEIDVLNDREYWYHDNGEDVPCDCVTTRKDAKYKIWVFRQIRMLSVGKCVDCGSVMGSFCPNGKTHKCWKRWDGKIYCRSCGYRMKGRK